MPDFSSINTIVFDAYGTLFDVFSLSQRLKLHFGDKADPINQVWRRKQLEYTWLRALMDRYKPFSELTEEALRFACSQTGTALPDEAMDDLMQQYYSLDAFDGVKEVLDELSGTHSLAILSNANPEMLEKAVEHNDIGQHLDAILSVDRIRKYKPSPEVYQLAGIHFNCFADEILFISSNTWDVCGARAAGLNVIWLNRSGSVMEELGLDPHAVIHHLSQLPSLL